MKNMPRSLCSGHVKKLQPKKLGFALGESSAGGPSHCLFFSMSDCRAGFFVEAFRNIVRSFRVKGSEMVWEKPKKLRNGLGASPNKLRNSGGAGSKLRNGRVKPKKHSEMVREKTRSPKQAQKWSGKGSKKLRNGSREAKKGSKLVWDLSEAQAGSEMVWEKPNFPNTVLL